MIILNRKKDRDLLKFDSERFFKSYQDSKISLEDLKNQLESIINQNNDIIDAKSKILVKDIKKGNKFYGTITTTIKDPNTGKKIRTDITDTFTMINPGSNGGNIEVKDSKGNKFKTSRRGIRLRSRTIDKQLLEAREKIEEEIKKKAEEERILAEKGIDFSKSDTPTRLRRVIESGIKNIWLCGPAGSGKSVMTRNLAKELGLPYLCISCGIGTSSTEFLGYKYPNRESTKFAEYYSKPSIILLDEFTALDPAVAQICNAALANDEIETTTGTVYRNPNCIIVATSNTYGSGASRQYVANNQLDASTIDRFVGGIIEVSYSESYESQYDREVVSYIHTLRNVIREYDLRRIASTRMIQAGVALKNNYVKDWKQQLIINWSDEERRIVNNTLSYQRADLHELESAA